MLNEADLTHRLRDDLRELQRDLNERALAEALRLLESPCFDGLTEQHVRAVAEYRPIEIAGERFFEHAWSRSKEASAMLGLAKLLGPEPVGEDLRRLRRSVGASDVPSPETEPPGAE
jgi:hypothetical protein